MWSFLNEDFESEYLSKENTEERLSMLHNKRKDAIKENNMEKLIMISGLMEIVNAKYEEAMEYFKSPLLDSNDSIVKLAKCEAKLNKAEKEEKYKQYCEVVQEIDNVVGHSHFNSLFMKLALGHAYYVLGENFHKQRKKIT